MYVFALDFFFVIQRVREKEHFSVKRGSDFNFGISKLVEMKPQPLAHITKKYIYKRVGFTYRTFRRATEQKWEFMVAHICPLLRFIY